MRPTKQADQFPARFAGLKLSHEKYTARFEGIPANQGKIPFSRDSSLSIWQKFAFYENFIKPRSR